MNDRTPTSEELSTALIRAYMRGFADGQHGTGTPNPITATEDIETEARATSPALDAIPTDDLIAELDRRNSIYEWTGIPHRARLSVSGETPEQRRIRNEPNAEEGWSR